MIPIIVLNFHVDWFGSFHCLSYARLTTERQTYRQTLPSLEAPSH